MDPNTFAVQLFEAGAIKFGEFQLKTGIWSPFYVDLRILISFPEIVEQIGDAISRILKQNTECELICGVPYTAIPFASWVSVRQRVPMLMRRKEAKAYGTKQMIEGHYRKGQKTLIIEDILSSGTSILETVNSLKEVGLSVTDTIVILDREQGGQSNLADLGIQIHSLIKITTLFDILADKQLITNEVKQKSIDWLQQNRVQIGSALIDQFKSFPELPAEFIPNKKSKLEKKNLLELANTAPHSIQKRLFRLIHCKKSNLCVSIDETDSKRVLQLIEAVGQHVVIVKLHADIIEDFNEEFATKIRSLADKLDFLIFEDRKFADIGNTVKLQFTKGLHKISEWADIVNCHALPGAGVLKGIESGLKSNGKRDVGCLIVAELSCAGNLINYEYTKQSVAMAESNPNLVIGFISQSRLSNNAHLVHMTPGVHLKAQEDSLGQQYVSPADAITKRGADVIIVGRGITESEDPLQATLNYKENAFQSLCERFHFE